MFQHFEAQRFTAIEIAAGLWTRFVERAQAGGGIQGHACAITTLVHQAHAIVFNHQSFGHVIAGAKFDDPMTAATAAGAGWDFREGVDG